MPDTTAPPPGTGTRPSGASWSITRFRMRSIAEPARVRYGGGAGTPGPCRLSHQPKNLSLADRSGISAIALESAIQRGVVDTDPIAPPQVGQQEAEVRRLVRAGVTIRPRDLDVGECDDRATLAAAAGRTGNVAERDERAGDHGAACPIP